MTKLLYFLVPVEHLTKPLPPKFWLVILGVQIVQEVCLLMNKLLTE